ncbi:hypothetical protein [Nesterenkonia populi]
MTDEEVEELERELGSAEIQPPTLGDASSAAVTPQSTNFNPYGWRLSGGGMHSFGFGTHNPQRPAGTMGLGVTGVHLVGHSGSRSPFASRTGYYTHRLDRGTPAANAAGWNWSPRRLSQAGSRNLDFTQTVWAATAEVAVR